LRGDQGGDDLGAAEVDGQDWLACGRFSHDEGYCSPEEKVRQLGVSASVGPTVAGSPT
jgi:hypothetical protein